MGVYKTLTICLYDRPDYTRRALEALARCDGIAEYYVIAYVDRFLDEATHEAGPIRKVKSGRALAGSLFAALPDPLLEELRKVDPASLTPEQAVALVTRLRELA